MDKQAVDSQENSARFSEQITAMRIEHEAAIKQSKEGTEKKIKTLESTCKKQEQELIRINHQDRVGINPFYSARLKPIVHVTNSWLCNLITFIHVQ